MNLKSILGVVLLAFGSLAGPVFHAPALLLSVLSSIGVAVGGIGVRQAVSNNQPILDMIAQGSWKTFAGALGILVAIALSPDVLNLVGPHAANIIEQACQLLMAIGLVRGVSKQNQLTTSTS